MVVLQQLVLLKSDHIRLKDPEQTQTLEFLGRHRLVGCHPVSLVDTPFSDRTVPAGREEILGTPGVTSSDREVRSLGRAPGTQFFTEGSVCNFSSMQKTEYRQRA